MTKDQLRMTNNELEARVIELETQLACKEEEADVLSLQLEDAYSERDGWQEKYERLEQEVIEEAAARPAIPFAEWYYTVHPKLGGNPDLRVIEATKHDRIIA